MASLAGSQERFDMGRVVGRAFGAISRNPVLFIGLSLLLIFLPQLVSQLLVAPALASNTAAGNFSLPAILSTVALGLLSVFFNYLLAAAVSYATVTDLGGGRPTIGAALAVGMRYALPLLGLAIVSGLGIYFGLLLLVVPGVIWGLMWSVATPVMVAEGLGIFDSLSRSRVLTKGWRGSIFLLLFVVFVLIFVPVVLTPLLTGAVTAGSPVASLSAPTLIVALLTTLAYVVFSAIIAAIYVELRTIKEGATHESLASIFA
jgi:hypothetical protein